MNPIDKFLDGFTMYRLTLYSMLAIIVAAFGTSALKLLGYPLLPLLGSLAVVIGLGFACHFVLVRIFSSAAGIESWLITSLILFLIIKPPVVLSDYAVLSLAVIMAMTSKYILTFHRRHIFNPVAITLVLLGLLGSGEIYWWVGSKPLLPVVAIVGLLLVRKLRRFDMVVPFLLLASVTYIVSRLSFGEPADLAKGLILSGPLIFFAAFMLTEPLTSPHTRRQRLLFAAVVGLLFGLQFKFPPLHSSPELALVIGNLLAFIVSSKQRTRLTYKGFTPMGGGIYEFLFTVDEPLHFTPGQYVEWTLPHKRPDRRGDRRYFTLASAPGSKEVRLTVRIDNYHSSSFKRALLILKPGNEIWISHLSGDFTLPHDTTKKVVMIAGGVGITPFRSMVRHDMNQKTKRELVLYYMARTHDGFAYAETFNEAAQHGAKINYFLTDKAAPPDWKGRTGTLTREIIMTETDCKKALYYLSGPNAMVNTYKKQLLKAKVPRRHIKTDYFPGF